MSRQRLKGKFEPVRTSWKEFTMAGPINSSTVKGGILYLQSMADT